MLKTENEKGEVGEKTKGGKGEEKFLVVTRKK